VISAFAGLQDLVLLSANEKPFSTSLIYGVTAVLSLGILLGGFFLLKKNRGWFLSLFASVTVVNLGYTLLALAPDLSFALHANRLAYLGSAVLPFAMLMILLKITETKYPRWLPWLLATITGTVFLVAASQGILPLYYEEVSFQIVNGTGKLLKVYGPLHPVYLFYLLGFFSAMIAVILRAAVKKTLRSTAFAVTMLLAVTVNLAVWAAEQIASIDFEMLSVSYIVSECFLLFAQSVTYENQRLKDQIREKERELRVAKETGDPGTISPEALEIFTAGLTTLTPAERAIYEAHLAGESTKEILERLNIKENTLKFHNKNLYGKLGVSSRKQLREIGLMLRPEGNSGAQQ